MSTTQKIWSGERFAMAIAAFVMVAGLALPNANAADIESTTAFSPPTIFAPGLSVPISNSFGAGTTGQTFLDHWTFTLGGGGLALGTALTIDIGNLFDLNFDTAVSGMYTALGAVVSPGSFTIGSSQFLATFAALAAGDYDFRVGGVINGIAGGFYGGNLRVVTNAVPEPEIYAMLVAGLGFMGFVARRRKAKIAAA